MGTARIIIENLGPFEYAEIELKPLTIFVGKNSTGKSFLVQLLWSLMITYPYKIPEALRKVESEINELVPKILEKIESGLDVNKEFRELIKLHIEILPKAIALSLQETFQKAFETTLHELIREGTDRATILIEGPRATLNILIEKSEIRASYGRKYTEFINKLRVEYPGPRQMRVSHKEREDLLVERSVIGMYDLAFIVISVLSWYVAESLKPFFAAPLNIAAFFPDGRAGTLRAALRPYIAPVLLTEGISYQDAILVSLYSKLARDLDNELIELDLIKPLLDELGCFPEAVFEHGVYTIYVKMWTGKRLPLYKAPSGVREILIAALALVSQGEPYVVIVEEPEAHLHPRAQRILARVIARAINELGKIAILTTHSDIVVYSLENLIMASELREKMKKLGLSESEILDPDKVAVYLVRPEGGKAVVERLSVTSEGIPEEEFAKVTEELADERAKILLLSEKRASLSQQS